MQRKRANAFNTRIRFSQLNDRLIKIQLKILARFIAVDIVHIINEQEFKQLLYTKFKRINNNNK